MPEAWIIEAACRPDGCGEKDTGALSAIHPEAARRPGPEHRRQRTGLEHGPGTAPWAG